MRKNIIASGPVSAPRPQLGVYAPSVICCCLGAEWPTGSRSGVVLILGWIRPTGIRPDDERESGGTVGLGPCMSYK